MMALAYKMARTIWALLAHDRTHQKGYTEGLHGFDARVEINETK